MLLDRFLEYLQHERRYSLHTVAAYRRDLQQFDGHLQLNGGHVDLIRAKHSSVRTWMLALVQQGISSRSVNRKLSALRAFYHFGMEVGDVDADPTALIEPPRSSKRLPEFVAESAMIDLFEPSLFPAGFVGLRDRLILELLYSTGMRLAELLGLKVADVDHHRGDLRVLGKRSKERMIPMSNDLAAKLTEYIAARKEVVSGMAEQALLLTNRGTPLARRTVQRIVKQCLGKVTTQQKRSPHVLRHTFATHLLNNGADLNAVKELLGHANLAATQVYTHNSIEKLRRMHGQAHPRGGE